RTDEPRVPDRHLALGAPGQDEPPVAGRVPERGRLVRRRRLATGGHNVASVPRTTVPVAESTPPQPCATATSAPATCRAPHSPRSCRVASTRRNMPYWPGCVYDSPPPFVFIGSAPPGPSLPSSTNAPPSPLAQNPRSSR